MDLGQWHMWRYAASQGIGDWEWISMEPREGKLDIDGMGTGMCML